MAKKTVETSEPIVHAETIEVPHDTVQPVDHHATGIISHAEFWLAVAFVVFIIVAFKPIRKGILSFLDKYAAGVRSELDEARALREEAQRTLADIQKKQTEALAEAQHIVAYAQQEAVRLKEQAAKELEENLKRREAQALEKITLAEAEAVRDFRQHLASTVISATERLMAQTMSPESDRAIFDQALSKTPRKLH